MFSFLLVAYCLLTPLLVLWLTYKYSFMAKLGSVVIAYTLGCLVALSGVLPALGGTEQVKQTLLAVSSASVPLAIPLMLFSSDVRSWKHLAPNFTKSLFSGLLACVLVAVAGFYLFGSSNPQHYAGVSAMFVGLYTGGTANMATIKEVAGVDNDTFLQAQIYQILVGAIYLLVVIVAGKFIVRAVLPKFKPAEQSDAEDMEVREEEKELFFGLFTKKNSKPLLGALALTLVILGLGYLVTLLFPKESFMAVFMLSISFMAILASLDKRVRALPHTFDAGVYLILVFSIAVASGVGEDMFNNLDFDFFLFVLFVTLGPFVMHILLNFLLRVDADTTLVSSIALVTSPAFVPVMAGTLKNREVVGPGITVGLIGYAVGTYLGYLVYLLLQSLF